MINQATHETTSSPEQLPNGYSLSDFNQLTPEQQSAYEQSMRLLLEPLYGSQDEALDKIRRAEDRQADVVLDDSGEPCATLVYKKGLVSEVHWDMRNGDTVRTDEAFEVKTLAIFHPDKDGGKGLGSWLVARAETLARVANAKGIVLTVTDESKAKDFFTHQQAYVWALYKTDKTPETSGHLLYKSLEAGGIDGSGSWFN
jgi:hypothetical protein